MNIYLDFFKIKYLAMVIIKQLNLLMIIFKNAKGYNMGK